MRSDKNGAQIAKEMGMSYPAPHRREPSLKEWKRRCGGSGAPPRADLEAEVRGLRAEPSGAR